MPVQHGDNRRASLFVLSLWPRAVSDCTSSRLTHGRPAANAPAVLTPGQYVVTSVLRSEARLSVALKIATRLLDHAVVGRREPQPLLFLSINAYSNSRTFRGVILTDFRREQLLQISEWPGPVRTIRIKPFTDAWLLGLHEPSMSGNNASPLMDEERRAC